MRVPAHMVLQEGDLARGHEELVEYVGEVLVLNDDQSSSRARATHNNANKEKQMSVISLTTMASESNQKILSN